MRSILIAFSMYSKIPVPQIPWDERSLSRALCAFPLVGAVIGAILYGWLRLSAALDLGALGAAGALVIPMALSGGIHMDGFCDSCDALASHQSRERKLEILKDSHTGAFAIICCGIYLLLFYGAWCEADFNRGTLALAMMPILSRSLSATAAVFFRNARGSGLLAAFTKPMDARLARVLLPVFAAASAAGMILAAPAAGAAAVISAAAVFPWYRWMAYRQFGGITGDTEGFFLQICECVMVISFVLAQKAGALL